MVALPTKTPRRTLPIVLPAPTPRNFSSPRATTSGNCCRWWKRRCCASARAASASASTAARRSTPSAWKPCPGHATASNARKSSNRDCSKKLRGKVARWMSKAAGDGSLLQEGNSAPQEPRRQLKQDAFSRVTIRAAENTAHWTVEHRSSLLIAGIAVVVILAVGLGGWYYLSTQDEKASLEFSQAVRTMNTPLRPAGVPAQPDSPSFASPKERADAAQKQFQTIVDHYPHTRTSDMARYFLGVTAADTGDNSAAERNFKEVASSGNRELASVAKLALRPLYGNSKRTKEAVDIYQQIIAKPTASGSKGTGQLPF